MKNEKDVKKKIKAILDKYEWFWFMPPANAYGKSGIADIIAIRHGTFLAIEAKFGTNKPTAQQTGFLNSIRDQHGFAFVVSDRNIDHLEKWCGGFARAVEAVADQKTPATEDGSMMLNAIAELSNKLLDT